MEHLLDLFKFFWDAFEGQGSQFSPFSHGFSFKRQSAPGTLRGPDTVNFRQASTLRSKGIHRHPYCRGLSLKDKVSSGPLGTLGPGGFGHCHNVHQASTLMLKGIHRLPFCRSFSLKDEVPMGPSGTLGGPDTVKIHQASALRSKGIHCNPYCRGLRVKNEKYLQDLWGPWFLGSKSIIR